ncbi:MAG: hypothetical protein JSW39_01295, partial [Desulfobacterales bacterium]
NRTGGGALQLLPERAAYLSEAEQRSGQVQNLLRGGLLRVEEEVAAVPEVAAEKSRKRGATREKKKG